jgi:hypothetical protein
MRFFVPAGIAVAVLTCFVASPDVASADPVTYTETATATGSLAGQSFTNALLTLTATGDTANVTSDGFQLAEMSVPLELTIEGLGSTMFTDPIIVVFNGHTGPNEAFGFGDTYPNYVQGYAILSTFIPYVGSFYDLQSDAGPIYGEALYNSGVSYNTAAGAFEITAAENAVFQVVVTPAATPEPGSLILLGTGVLGFCGVLRRRMRA